MDIIVLIFLIFRLVKLAKQKGEQPLKWALYGILAWIAGEFVGVLISFSLVGKDILNNIVYYILLSFGTAYLFFLLLKSSLESKPDVDEAGA
jgi:hypothetical protein